jgi:hypothetical protein
MKGMIRHAGMNSSIISKTMASNLEGLKMKNENPTAAELKKAAEILLQKALGKVGTDEEDFLINQLVTTGRLLARVLENESKVDELEKTIELLKSQAGDPRLYEGYAEHATVGSGYCRYCGANDHPVVLAKGGK